MRFSKSHTKKITTLLLSGLVLTQLYQNCGQMVGFETLDMSSMALSLGSQGGTDMNHPSSSEVALPTQKVHVANREYVASLLREVFTNPSTPVPDLEGLIDRWIINRGAQFGLGCNPYSTYSGRDCGGDVTNANLPTHVDGNTIRESYRVQFCENVLGTNEGVEAIVSKLSPRPTAPNRQAIAQIYGLFYRGDGPTEFVINSLMVLDRHLVKQNETVLERWRAIALQVCESPGWQLQ